MRRRFLALLILATACNEPELKDEPRPSFGAPANEKPSTPGNSVSLGLSAAQQGEFDATQAALRVALATDEQSLQDAYRVPFEALSYAGTEAQHLDLIQASPFSLDDEESAALSQNGFVISARQEFPSFTYGYSSLYMSDLPLFISADSLLDAVHRSYDKMLKEVEEGWLLGELTEQLVELRQALATLNADATTREHLDLYLAVALSLLQESPAAPVAGASSATIDEFVNRAQAASGTKQVVLFDVERDIDFSQFKPRGHYTDSQTLSRYFRAMMWLGRIDFRLIETQPDGSQVFHRLQFEALSALGRLFEQTGFARFQAIDSVITAFVGDSDYMTVPQIAELMSDLGGTDGAASKSDEEIAQAIIDGGYGAQQIASHLIVNVAGTTLPLNRSFAVFGQRYVIDSHVFSNVVWDRTERKRMMPNPLDVAFAALGNDAALPLLAPELEQYAYAGNLAAVRTLADEHDEAYWGRNLYNLWLGGLRALSVRPNAEAPSLTRTEPWSRRILNTQLASWAELRHDTILYAKQSYTSGALCEFPDAFVDPYPAFYAALERYAEHGRTIIASVTAGATAVHYDGETVVPLGEAIETYFQELGVVASTLREMAEYQEQGLPFTEVHMAFVNRAVSVSSSGCAGPYGPVGWYADLFFEPSDGAEFDPTIADVHTQPTDESGSEVGRVLHVGTGPVRLMVVTAETCEGPKAYAGLASSYYEHTTGSYERLDDPQWEQMLLSPQPLVPWQRDIVVE